MSLVEILVVIAIIGILVAAVGLIGRRVGQGGQVKLTRQYMQILTSAIDEYHTAAGGWPEPPNAPNKMFPGDPAPDSWNRPYENEVYPTQPPGTSGMFRILGGGRLLSIQGLYVYLYNVPEARRVLDRLPEAAKARDAEWPDLTATPGNPPYTNALVILDAWRVPMRYRGYTYRNNGRPFLWSAGPDGRFATDPNRPEATGGQDDIFSDR